MNYEDAEKPNNTDKNNYAQYYGCTILTTLSVLLVIAATLYLYFKFS